MENEEKKEIEINEKNPDQVPETEVVEEKAVDAGENLVTDGESESIKAEEPTVSSDEPKEDDSTESGEEVEAEPESESIKAEEPTVSKNEPKEDDSTESGEAIEAEPESEPVKVEEPTDSSDEPKEDATAAPGEAIEPAPESEPVKTEEPTVSGDEPKEDATAAPGEEIEPEPESHILIGPNGEIFDIDSEFQWYFVQVLSGQEDKIAKILLEIIKVRHFQEEITDVLVLKAEKAQRNRKGEKKLVLKKLYPGYILIRMRMKDENWSLIRNSNNVIDFVGGKYNPNSISQQEWEEIFLGKKKAKRDEVRIKFSVNEKVKIVGGAFANFYGDIAEINEDKEHLKILLSIFGRLTPVELGFDEVEKI
ncbi:transcription termination/antitermination factor NusG [Candidatus Dependentiae bacterium]|nr:transcription termination/antitermination factor NusG [Candidatus Dependentiae bacterium]